MEEPEQSETPPEYDRAEPHYFGMTPPAVVAALGGVAGLAGIVLLATGSLAVGILLLVAGLLLTFVFLEQARHRPSTQLDHVAIAAIDNSRAYAGFTGVTVFAWTRAGREVARRRMEARLIARRRAKVQYELGGAVHEADDTRVETLNAQMATLDGELERCLRDTRVAVAKARLRMRQERDAIAATQVRRPAP
ncbi:MAG TPA: hypothetical protein VFW85_08900 [Gaiellaceae bacterium]|nr:hypothetical protein [Gaiellaceae bacterium]